MRAPFATLRKPVAWKIWTRARPTPFPRAASLTVTDAIPQASLGCTRSLNLPPGAAQTPGPGSSPLSLDEL